MLHYHKNLKSNARALRRNATDAENLLWFYLRRKQIKETQFYRQKPIGNYIVDFYAPTAKLVIEIDGGQHFEEIHRKKDIKRDAYLKKLGLYVLRFDNLQVLETIEEVLTVIFEVVA